MRILGLTANPFQHHHGYMADKPVSATFIGLALDPIFAKHDTGPGHPEQIARYTAITNRLTECGLVEKCKAIPIREISDEELGFIHDPAYVQLAIREITAGVNTLSTGDTTVCKDSLTVARRAAGTVCNAIDAIFASTLQRAFCAIRPPGHHARPAHGMGFCVFNNVAMAARYAQRKHGIKRVAIVDWDVHHGNGTQDIFYEDPTVHFFSTHQCPLYPGTGPGNETGSGDGKGSTMNRPLPSGSGMTEIGNAFQKDWAPAMDDFKPQLVLISAGFDSRIDDPLGGFTLTDDDFIELTKIVTKVADKHAKGRVMSCLEGGYNVEGLAFATEAHLRALF